MAIRGSERGEMKGTVGGVGEMSKRRGWGGRGGKVKRGIFERLN